ncbi:NAD(P)H-hydrate dehydratase [Lentzea flava]|uniref:Bifunctional NAD(P)H-hydrate repair enzyme n=1 Tax=Lentzea flava TaxID=103732 RepID=A0ABQ2V0Q1_9PSEU|nr:NAD(P)H-hydrate dehydratase [Lentzea flava]MCP2202796.1 yjeF C-terminal region, hydroxyethylthiazole kinase-related/yjeF N-terminal region [Lentzea flava]GGU63493.1 bifunctional NAD(P)H-hydrate repair enzyme [Lentzea flava]
MKGVWHTERVKSAEEELMAVVPPGSLMRKAAFGVATHALRLLSGRRRVTLLVGAGNNGGDALWAGYFLRRRGVAVSAVLLNPAKAHAEGLAAFRRAGGRVVDEVGNPDLVIDGIVGLSARGPLRPDAAALVDSVRAPILAVDLPSGIDPDTGEISGPFVRAHTTVTFGVLKPVHALAECGEVHLVDIGLRPKDPDFVLLDRSDIAWPVPGPSDDKYTQGVTGVAAGSATYPGAAVLATGAAVLATSGMVRYAGPAADAIRARWPETICTGSITDAGRVQAWVVGPGMGTGSSSDGVLRFVLEAGVPVIADADAITLLAQHPTLWDARDPDTPLVLTPHDREFERLAGPVGADRVGAARKAAQRFNAVVLLKGHRTVVAAPDGRALVNSATSSWPATAGSGDVLSGIIGALLAAGVNPFLAAGYAAYAHVLAAELAADGAPVPASGLMSAIPEAIRAIRAR